MSATIAYANYSLRATNCFEYDVFGNRTKLTDAKGNETAYEYDLGNDLTKKTYADSSHVDSTYDVLGLYGQKNHLTGNEVYGQIIRLTENDGGKRMG